MIELDEHDRARIRRETAYALAVAQELKQAPPTTRIQRLLGYLSNGFVLLIVGALVTSFLAPYLQRLYQERQQRYELMRDCLSEFLVYSNSIWQEYYLVVPLVLETSLDKVAYLKYFQGEGKIKLDRYDAFAKLKALSLAFEPAADQESDIATQIDAYAVVINSVSSDINRFLRNMYCRSNACSSVGASSYDRDFVPYDSLQHLARTMQQTEGRAEALARLMIKQLTSER